ncbi:hypothetical protein KUTeg_020017 [Tegillarca granosa]|uniref:CUE domain-containing protein n=1 Tax=Tegillarca granosa TaxID=220873 RepID=A0ABQ9EE39_TEGGR|nr:hypothetical protein KUTeg_020017 [Tegillarca granosa]
MPVILLERIPIPSLRTYTSITVLLLSCVLFHAHRTVTNFQEKPVSSPSIHVDDNGVSIDTVGEDGTDSVDPLYAENFTLPYDSYAWNLCHVLKSEVWCVWTMVNTAYCCFILLGKLIQKMVFGELRVVEQQHLKDKFWNFLFYKFIFIFGVMNVQTMEEVVEWVAWFTLSFSPMTSSWVHVRLLSLLCCIFLSCSGLLCLILGIRTSYVVCRYLIHLYDVNNEGVWENRSRIVYYTELIFELAVLSVDFGHHLHMLLWGNIFLSMASLVICMQLRHLFYEFQRRLIRHKNYRKVVRNMEASSCLLSWLEQDTSCPICRVSLNETPSENDPNGNVPNERGAAPPNIQLPPQPIPQNHQAMTNHFFHFDGSRYVSWLPSFSVEVTQLMPGTEQRIIQTSQLDSMARQVSSVFPHIPLNRIMEDLRVTRSVDFTIENILEGRLEAPQPGSAIMAALGGEEDSDDDSSESQILLPSTLSSTGAAAIQAHHQSILSPMSGERGYNQLQEPLMERSTQENISIHQQRNIPAEESRDFNWVSPTGSRFSKSASEREAMRYITSLSSQASSSTQNSEPIDTYPIDSAFQNMDRGNDDNDRTRLRELTFLAAQRRIEHPENPN